MTKLNQAGQRLGEALQSEIKLLWRLLIVLGVIHLFVIILVLLPRQYTRWIRHTLAAWPMALWVSFARLMQIGHEILWQRGNGNGKA